MRKNVNTFTYNIISLFKTNAPQDFGKRIMYGSGKKLSKPKKQKKSEENIIKV